MIVHKIKIYRELRNFSQNYIADKLGISQNAYSKIETNQTKLTVNRLKQIAFVLEIPEEELINKDRPIVFNNNHFEKNYAAQSQTIHEAQKDLIDHYKEEVAILRKEKEFLLDFIKNACKK